MKTVREIQTKTYHVILQETSDGFYKVQAYHNGKLMNSCKVDDSQAADSFFNSFETEMGDLDDKDTGAISF